MSSGDPLPPLRVLEPGRRRATRREVDTAVTLVLAFAIVGLLTFVAGAIVLVVLIVRGLGA